MKSNDLVRGFQKLWAPWRMKYIERIDSPKDEGCIFCTKPAADDDSGNFIVHRGKTCFVILNIYPYNNGHIMVIPNRHTANISDLGAEEKLELMETIDLTIQALREAYGPDGFNVGANMGRTAGAGIAEHLHFHIVPRWNGDTNFMPVIGCTKVICESPEDTYARIKPVFDKLLEDAG